MKLKKALLEQKDHYERREKKYKKKISKYHKYVKKMKEQINKENSEMIPEKVPLYEIVPK